MGQMTPSIDHVKYFIWRKTGAGARRRGERVDVLQKRGEKKSKKSKSSKMYGEVLMQLTCPSRWSASPVSQTLQCGCFAN